MTYALSALRYQLNYTCYALRNSHAHLGTAVAISAKIGAMTLRGRGKVCEYAEHDVIAVRAELGALEVVITWLFRPNPHGGTEITADVAYIAGSGLAGRAVAKIAETAIGPKIESSERSLRKQLSAAASSDGTH